MNGCQLNDERGQQLIYDSQNRLLDVEASPGQAISCYRYDSHDHLVTSQHGNESEALRFYQGEQLSTLVQDGRKTRLLYHADQPLGQQVAGDNAQTLLLQTDANHSVIAESQQNNLRTAVYSAYGNRHSDQPMFSLRAFNGEVRENSGWYLLGRGYRAYNPSLMRFHSPDSFSPFGSGGVNPYCYCLGNPIALRDPTGHSSIGFSGRPKRPDEGDVPRLSRGAGASGWLPWLFVGVGVVATIAGIVATVLTAGAAAPLAGKAFAFTVAKAASIGAGTVLGAGSTVTGGLAAAGDPEAGEWSMYLGATALPFALFGYAFSGAVQYLQYLDDAAIGITDGLDFMVSNVKPFSTGSMPGFGNPLFNGLKLPRIPLVPPIVIPPASPPATAPTAPTAPPPVMGNPLKSIPPTPPNARPLPPNAAAPRLKGPPPLAPKPDKVHMSQIEIALAHRNAGKNVAEGSKLANRWILPESSPDSSIRI